MSAARTPASPARPAPDAPAPDTSARGTPAPETPAQAAAAPDPSAAVTRRFTARSADTRAAILAAARARFAADGYEKTTIRAVAADAGIDASMVMRYYGDKASLFTASSRVELPLPAPRAADPETLAADYATALVHHWEHDDTDVERLIIRTALTHPEAARRMQQIFDEQIKPPVLAALPDDPAAELRAAAIFAQVFGFIVGRYLLGIEPLASADPAELEEFLRAAIHTHLTLPADHFRRSGPRR